MFISIYLYDWYTYTLINFVEYIIIKWEKLLVLYDKQTIETKILSTLYQFFTYPWTEAHPSVQHFHDYEQVSYNTL
jgi:hypothetical protein